MMSSSGVSAVNSAAISSGMALPRNVMVRNPRCIGCGPLNPHGLHLAFAAEAGAVKADWIAGSDWESFPGVIHGGILCTALDEAMSNAILATGVQAFTVELRLRYRRKLSTGRQVEVRGWVVQKYKRRISAEAAVCAASGEEYVHAWGVFLLPPPQSLPSAAPVGEQP